MRARIDPSGELRALASAQSGVVFTQQTALLGLLTRCSRCDRAADADMLLA